MKIVLQNTLYNTSFGNGIENSVSQQICLQDKNAVFERIPKADCFTKNNTDVKLIAQDCNCDMLQSFTLKDFHNKIDKFKIEEYLLLSACDKSKIRNMVFKLGSIQEAANSSVELAVDYKNFLDKKYGKDNYVFISIGVSPSLITKAFECMGVETRYLPISELSKAYESLDRINFSNYFDFLKKQGLSHEEINTDNKTYIFADYTGSGRTLENFERLIKEEFGLNSPKTEFRSINKDLRQSCLNTKRVNQYIDTYFRYADAHNFSSIAHLPVLTIGDTKMTNDRLTLHKEIVPKLFNFVVMDKLDEMGLLKENPKNLSAL